MPIIARRTVISKVGDCLKELEETAYRLELLVESDTVSPRKMSALLRETNEFLAIFTTVSKNPKAPKVDS